MSKRFCQGYFDTATVLSFKYFYFIFKMIISEFLNLTFIWSYV